MFKLKVVSKQTQFKEEEKKANFYFYGKLQNIGKSTKKPIQKDKDDTVFFGLKETGAPRADIDNGGMF